MVSNAAAHSGLVSNKLEGAIRSGTFTITKPYLHVRVAGNKARLNIVVDNFTLIRDPIYGSLKHAIRHEKAAGSASISRDGSGGRLTWKSSIIRFLIPVVMGKPATAGPASSGALLSDQGRAPATVSAAVNVSAESLRPDDRTVPRWPARRSKRWRGSGTDVVTVH